MDILNPQEQEQSVIGILAGGVSQDTASARQLSPEDFSDRTLGRIFAACLRLLEQRRTINLKTLDEHLTREYGQDQCANLMQAAMTAANKHMLNAWQLPEAVRIIREASRRRRLIRNSEAIARGAADPQRDIDDLINRARNDLRSANPSSTGIIGAQDAMLAAYEALESAEKPIPTGIRDLDSILQGGLHKGEMTVLGARPAVGKSAVLLQAALSAAHAGHPVAYVSLEMSDKQLGARLLGRYSDVNTGLLRGGSAPTEGQWVLLAEALGESGNALGERLTFITRGGMTVEELTAEVISLHDSGKCDLLVVDYLQLLRSRQKTGNDFERLGIVSRALKAITLDLGIPVLTAAQVKRQNNGGVLRAPGLDELRGSGDIEQDADNVILLHRPETADDPTLASYGYQERYSGLWERAQRDGKRIMHYNVAKQRQGATAQAWSIFDPARMHFESPDSAAKGAD